MVKLKDIFCKNVFLCAYLCIKFIFIQKDVRVKIKHQEDCLKFQVFLKKKYYERSLGIQLLLTTVKLDFTLSPLSRDSLKNHFFYLPKTQLLNPM